MISTWKLTVYLVRYCEPTLALEDRSKQLLDNFGIRCHCVACTDPVSEQRRKEFLECELLLSKQMSMCAQFFSDQVLMRKCKASLRKDIDRTALLLAEKALELLLQEGLLGFDLYKA